MTMNTGTEDGGGMTRVGDRCLFMVASHVAHDCHIGDVESRPDVFPFDMKIEKVDDVAETNAIDVVANRTSADNRERVDFESLGFGQIVDKNNNDKNRDGRNREKKYFAKCRLGATENSSPTSYPRSSNVKENNMLWTFFDALVFSSGFAGHPGSGYTTIRPPDNPLPT